MMPDYVQLDQLKEKLDSLRPLPEAVVRNLHEDLVLRWTYNSDAIEGNTLTLKETKVALEGITVGGKTLREHKVSSLIGMLWGSMISCPCRSGAKQKIIAFRPIFFRQGIQAGAC